MKKTNWFKSGRGFWKELLVSLKFGIIDCGCGTIRPSKEKNGKR